MAKSTLIDDGESFADPRAGHANRDLGPSDSSDSGSDRAGLPQGDSDSDSAGTGDRASVNIRDDGNAPDLIPDEAVDEQRVSMGSEGSSVESGLPD